MTRRALDERGLTLTEVTIVGVLGTLVMAGLVAFYLSSQGVWIDASTQAIAQREATFVLSTIADSIRVASSAVVSDSPDADHQQLTLLDKDGNTLVVFGYAASDSTVHFGTSLGGGAGDHGAMMQSHVDHFRTAADAAKVSVDLQLHSTTGQTIAVATTTVLVNHP